MKRCHFLVSRGFAARFRAHGHAARACASIHRKEKDGGSTFYHKSFQSETAFSNYSGQSGRDLTIFSETSTSSKLKLTFTHGFTT